ncbi:MAG: DsbA family protein [Candidatus Bathyarchaeia archaeon]
MVEEEKPVEEKKVSVKLPSVNRWVVSTILLIIISIILVAGWILTPRTVITGEFVKMNILSKEEIGKKVIDYINNNLVTPGTSASLISVEEERGVYKILVSYQGQSIPVYATMEGSYLFLQTLDMSKEIPREGETQSEFDAPDREKPNVKFFVMSFCPYGNQAEAGLEPVYRLLKDKVEWEPHYVIYSNYGTYPEYCLDKEKRYCSMHGIQELNQDVRELCIWKYYAHDLWWDFVIQVNNKCSAGNADTCWEPIARDLGIDVEKIKTCQKDEAESLLENEIELNEEYGVRGSPTVFINDKLYQGSRTPEAYKQAICTGFVTKPAECSQTLSTSGSSSSGQC